MKISYLIWGVFLLLLGNLVISQETRPVQGYQEAPINQDSLFTSDSLGYKPDSIVNPDSVMKARPLVRHSFNHREQIITGGVIMGCIIAVLTIMNNYNPQ